MHSEVEDENGIDRSLDEIMGDGKDEQSAFFLFFFII